MSKLNDEFRIYYNQVIHPDLKKMDRLRRRWVNLCILTVFIIIIAIGLMLHFRLLLLSLIIVLPLLLLISYLIWRFRIFKSTFKPKIVPLILDFIQRGVNYGTLNYQAKNFISLDNFQSSELFEVDPYSYEGEDLISGNIGELPFQSCELSVIDTSRVRTGAASVFKGIFCLAIAPLNINGKVLIVPSDLKQYHARSIKAFFSEGNIQHRNLLNNKSFNALFSVYASNNINLSTVLPSTLQNAFVNFYTASEKGMFISFINDKIYIAILKDKNLLEPTLFKPNTSFRLVQSFYQDILGLTALIKIIDQNN